MQESIRDEAERAGLTIGAPRAWPLDPVDRAPVQAHLWSMGYFATAPSVPEALREKCRAGIELVRAHDAPPLAVFAFDAPWELAALLGDHAAAAVDGEARLLPAFWAWRLDHRDDGRGWAPHRDHPERELDGRGAPTSLTLWVPLTDATPDNGCIHVVPAPWDPQYLNPNATPEVLFLQSIRAVPAGAGAVLGWTSKLLHWGALADATAAPRISLSFEYQAGHCLPFDGITYPLGWIPDAAERRALIARQWTRYQHMHASSADRGAALTRVVDALLG